MGAQDSSIFGDTRRIPDPRFVYQTTYPNRFRGPRWTVPVFDLPYVINPNAIVPYAGPEEPDRAWVPYAVAAGAAAVLVLIGYSVYQRFEVMKAVAAKEGSDGVLKMQAGEAAIGLGTALATRAMEPNGRRRRRRRRR